VRNVLSMLKRDDPPVDLTVYPVQVIEGDVYAKLF
jgi:hypothetical protein